MGECNIVTIHDRAVNLYSNLDSLKRDLHSIWFGSGEDDDIDRPATSICLTGIDEEMICSQKVLEDIFKTLESIKNNNKVG